MSARTHRGPPENWAPPFACLCCVSAVLGMLWSPVSLAFNLDVDKLTVYSGPEGSYFGYSLDFYIPDARTASVLVGAPKANTSQPDIVEGGAVYYCPWPAERSAQCKQIPFDTTRGVGAWDQKKVTTCGARGHTLLILLGWPRQADFCEFKAGQSYNLTFTVENRVVSQAQTWKNTRFGVFVNL